MKTWARLGDGNAIVEIFPPLPDGVEPGRDVFQGKEDWNFVDVTGTDAKVGYLKTEGGQYAPPPPPTISAGDLKTAAAAKRYLVEVGGVNVGDMVIATDDRSKTLIMGARDKAKDDATFTTQFKIGTSDWVDLDAPHIIAIGEAILDHVDACFAAERAIDKAIDEGSVKTLEDVAGWNWPS